MIQIEELFFLQNCDIVSERVIYLHCQYSPFHRGSCESFASSIRTIRTEAIWDKMAFSFKGFHYWCNIGEAIL